jgi:hypothetical protein
VLRCLGVQCKCGLGHHRDEEETLGKRCIEGAQGSIAQIAHVDRNLERQRVGRKGWEVAGGPRGIRGSTAASNVSKQVPLGWAQ